MPPSYWRGDPPPPKEPTNYGNRRDDHVRVVDSPEHYKHVETGKGRFRLYDRGMGSSVMSGDITAHTRDRNGNYKQVGYLSWYPGKPEETGPKSHNGEIHYVHVSPPHRRKGIASAMLDFARERYPEHDVRHSNLLSDDAKAWSAKHASFHRWLPDGRDALALAVRPGRPCEGCGGTGYVGAGEGCGACDESGRDPECPCGILVVRDTSGDWTHADGSISHDGRFHDESVAELMRKAGMRYIRNPESSTAHGDFGEQYGQHIEPAGRYLNERSGDHVPEGWETGEVHFRNPLRIPFGGGYQETSNWKHQLYQRYDGATGHELSQAIVNDGHDGIITHDKHGTSEVVDLTHLYPQRRIEGSSNGLGRERVDAFREQHFPGAGSSRERTIAPSERTGRDEEYGERRHVVQPTRELGDRSRKEVPLEYSVTDHGPKGRAYSFPKRDVRREPVHHVYRAVSTDEWSQAQQRGHLRSDGRGTVEDWEGTNAAVDPATAMHYLPRSGTGHVLKIKVHPAEKWYATTHDDYPRTRESIPLDRVEHVTPQVHTNEHGIITHIEENRRSAARWLPTRRLFGPTHGLDKRLFDGQHLRPDVARFVLDTLGRFWTPRYGPGWRAWARVYLAGSEASEWTSETLEGNNDFDVLIGVDYARCREEVGSLAQLTDLAITDRMNSELRADLIPHTDPTWITIEGRETGPWSNTYYVNADSYDIRAIKPYAAYDITRDSWAVKPPHLPDWSIEDFPQGHALVQECWGYEDVVRAILRQPEPYRSQQGDALWRHLHSDRSRAFGPQGEGWFDAGNVIEKFLDQRGLWEPLAQTHFDAVADPNKLLAPANWSNDPR